MRLCLVRGCGDIGSAVAHALFSAGHAVLIHDVADPGFARRGMAFTDAMYGGSATLEGITGRRTDDVFSIRWMLEQHREIPLAAGDFRKMLDYLRPQVLIDARMNKRSIPDRQSGLVPLTIGLGPNFIAGETTDLVVETAWEALGKIIDSGSSLPLSGEPRPIDGYGRERYVYAPIDGRFETDFGIGAKVSRGETVACIGAAVIRAPLDGCLRGITHAGAAVKAATKVVEIDPRGDPAKAFGIAERPGKLALAVLAAVAGQLCPVAAGT
jgi:xanthine dehydrogenase accessory factor